MVGQRIVPDEEDWAEVEVLRARLEKTIQLTKKIKTSQANLESSGRNVRHAINPIYGNTQSLQVTGTNIDNVNDALNNIREPMDVKAQEEYIIQSGPWKTGEAEFIASMHRIIAAVSRPISTNLSINARAINELQALLKSGSNQLEDLFVQKLEAESIPVEPLHYVTKQLPFPVITEETLSFLKKINDVIANPATQMAVPENEGIQTIRKYAEVRSKYMSSTLENLAAASLNTAKKTAPDLVYRRGTNGIGTYAMAMEGLLRMEYYGNARSIFSPSDATEALHETCRRVFGGFADTMKELNAHIRANLSTDCYLAFELIDIVTGLSDEISNMVGEGPTHQLLENMLKPIRDTARTCLPELLDETRRRVMHIQTLPTDGAAVPVTVDTMTRLQNMTAFLNPISAVLVSIGEGNWTSIASVQRSSAQPSQTSFEAGANGNRLFAHYALDTVDILLQNLEAKATNLYKSKTVIGVFLLNNVAVVDRAVQNSELRGLLSDSISRIEGWRKKGVTAFKDGWKGPSSYLFEAQYTNRGGHRPPSGGASAVNSADIVKALTSKERDSIKDRFRSFNASFEEMVHRQKSLAMEKEVRTSLAREVQATLEPLYGRFWDRYHEIDKGKGKYVRYDKGQLAAVLAGLG